MAGAHRKPQTQTQRRAYLQKTPPRVHSLGDVTVLCASKRVTRVFSSLFVIAAQDETQNALSSASGKVVTVPREPVYDFDADA